MKRSGILFLFMLIVCVWTETVFAMSHQKDSGQEPPLLSEYWAEGSEAAENLNAYLHSVTDESSPDFIPVEDRIAVFDLDGTLMCETFPFCFEYMVFSDYVQNHSEQFWNKADEIFFSLYNRDDFKEDFRLQISREEDPYQIYILIRSWARPSGLKAFYDSDHIKDKKPFLRPIYIKNKSGKVVIRWFLTR